MVEEEKQASAKQERGRQKTTPKKGWHELSHEGIEELKYIYPLKRLKEQHTTTTHHKSATPVRLTASPFRAH